LIAWRKETQWISLEAIRDEVEAGKWNRKVEDRSRSSEGGTAGEFSALNIGNTLTRNGSRDIWLGTKKLQLAL
jgi:hypothetical protein